MVQNWKWRNQLFVVHKVWFLFEYLLFIYELVFGAVKVG